MIHLKHRHTVFKWLFRNRCARKEQFLISLRHLIRFKAGTHRIFFLQCATCPELLSNIINMTKTSLTERRHFCIVQNLTWKIQYGGQIICPYTCTKLAPVFLLTKSFSIHLPAFPLLRGWCHQLSIVAWYL